MVGVAAGPALCANGGFMVGPGVGVTIGRGIWHYQLTALDADAKFVVLMWKDHSTDEEIVSIPPVELAALSN